MEASQGLIRQPTLPPPRPPFGRQPQTFPLRHWRGEDRTWDGVEISGDLVPGGIHAKLRSYLLPFPIARLRDCASPPADRPHLPPPPHLSPRVFLRLLVAAREGELLTHFFADGGAGPVMVVIGLSSASLAQPSLLVDEWEVAHSRNQQPTNRENCRRMHFAWRVLFTARLLIFFPCHRDCLVIGSERCAPRHHSFGRSDNRIPDRPTRPFHPGRGSNHFLSFCPLPIASLRIGCPRSGFFKPAARERGKNLLSLRVPSNEGYSNWLCQYQTRVGQARKRRELFSHFIMQWGFIMQEFGRTGVWKDFISSLIRV